MLAPMVKLPPMPRPLKLVVGTLGGLVVAFGVVVITASAAGFNLSDALHPAASPSPTIVLAPVPSPGRGQVANAAARAVSQAVLQAEAQVLGLRPAQLNTALRQGATVHQLATQRGITQAVFNMRFQSAVTAILDRDVQQGILTQQQEQAAINRLAGGPPNWDTVSAIQARPTPSPAKL
jgi:hypothetical protein